MKATDIKIGQDYAIQRYGSENSRWPTDPQRATVLGVEKHSRRVTTSARWDMRGHESTSLMAQVEYREGRGVQKGIEWVILGKVLRPWAEQAKIIAAEQAQEAEAETQVETAKRVATALAEALEARAMVAVVDVDRYPSFAPPRVRVFLTPDEAEALANALASS